MLLYCTLVRVDYFHEACPSLLDTTINANMITLYFALGYDDEFENTENRNQKKHNVALLMSFDEIALSQEAGLFSISYVYSCSKYNLDYNLSCKITAFPRYMQSPYWSFCRKGKVYAHKKAQTPSVAYYSRGLR